MNVLGIDNILLAVGNLDQARAFYGRALGLPEKFAVVDAGIVCYRLGGEEPGLLLRVDPDLAAAPPRSTPRAWLEVPDARAASRFLQDRGVAPLPPHGKSAPVG